MKINKVPKSNCSFAIRLNMQESIELNIYMEQYHAMYNMLKWHHFKAKKVLRKTLYKVLVKNNFIMEA